MTEDDLPVFLGVSVRAARRGFSWDLIGVSNVTIFSFFPQNLGGLQCVLAIPRRALREGYSCRVLFINAEKAEDHAWSDLVFSSIPHTSDGSPPPPAGFAIPALVATGDSVSMEMLSARTDFSSMEIIPCSAPPLVIGAPSRILVDIEIEGQRFRRGEFACGYMVPPPMTQEERRAIASRPGAPLFVQMELACKKCNSGAVFFAPLDPSTPKPTGVRPDAVALDDAPATWSCICGYSKFELEYLKRGVHELFRHPIRRGSPVQFVPLYEAGRIQSIIAEYEQLIESATEEEPVQKYLEQNPLFWAFLSPQRILLKPAVLTKKKADFGVLSTQKILYLIELEKPSTRLTNHDGSISAEIQRGANQIRDWQLVVDDHKLALLSELGFKEGDVQEIRYILIGGLARRSNLTGLTKLRRTPFAPNTDFYCFDELASFLHSLAAELNRL